MEQWGEQNSLYAGMQVTAPRGMERLFKRPEIHGVFLTPPNLLISGPTLQAEEHILNPQVYFALKRREQVITNLRSPAALHQRLLMAERLGMTSAVAILQGEPLSPGLRHLLTVYPNLFILVIDPLAYLKKLYESAVPYALQSLALLLAPENQAKQQELVKELHQATSWAEFTGQQAAYDSQYLLPDWHAADLIQLNPYSDTDSTTSLLLLNDFIDVQTLDRETEMYRTLRPITLQLHLNHTPTLTPYLLRQLNPIRNMRGQLMLHLDPTDLSTNPALEHLAARGISSTLELSNQEKAQLRTQYSITTVLTPPAEPASRGTPDSTLLSRLHAAPEPPPDRVNRSSPVSPGMGNGHRAGRGKAGHETALRNSYSPGSPARERRSRNPAARTVHQ